MLRIIVVVYVLIGVNIQGQFLDLNFFKPKISVYTEFLDDTRDSSLSYNSSGVSAMIPIKSKLELKVNWREALTSKSLKDAIGSVTPAVYQIFANVGGGYSEYLNPSNLGAYQFFYAGSSGIRLKFHDKKLHSLIYNINLRLSSDIRYKSNVELNPSLFIGTAKIVSLKTMILYGGYLSYFRDRVIPSPVLMINHRWSSKWSYTLLLPKQAKLTVKISKKFKQDIAVSFRSNNHAFRNVGPPVHINQVLLETGLRVGTQSRWKIWNKNFLYVELGWQDYTRTAIVDGYSLAEEQKFSGGIFAKIKLNIALGKALLDSKILDFEL